MAETNSSLLIYSSIVYLRSHVKTGSDIFFIGDPFLSNWIDDSADKPKSLILMCPFVVSKMFSGFKSLHKY